METFFERNEEMIVKIKRWELAADENDTFAFVITAIVIIVSMVLNYLRKIPIDISIGIFKYSNFRTLKTHIRSHR